MHLNKSLLNIFIVVTIFFIILVGFLFTKVFQLESRVNQLQKTMENQETRLIPLK
jgi:cell division protein FtsL